MEGVVSFSFIIPLRTFLGSHFMGEGAVSSLIKLASLAGQGFKSPSHDRI